MEGILSVKAIREDSDRWDAWHAGEAQEAVDTLNSDAASGLTETEATRRLQTFGPNCLPEPRRRSLFMVFLAQFRNPLIYLLFGAAAIAVGVGEISDAIVILVVVLVNASIGVIQEGRAERALLALRQIGKKTCRVLREGRERTIDAKDVVIGDILVLGAGDAVAADARLLRGSALQLTEAPLTGESEPVAKVIHGLSSDTPLSDRRNMVYAGTHVAAGHGYAIVVATGLRTAIGAILILAETGKEPKTPLERRIDVFGRWVTFTAAGLFLLVFGLGLLRRVPFSELLMVAISQVVGLIPEGMPAAMTVALAIGVQRMAKRRAIVRRLAAVEALGSTTVILSDKTGTLTKNEMTVRAILLPDGRSIRISGAGYTPEGQFFEHDRVLDVQKDERLIELVEAAVLCSDADLAPSRGVHETWVPVGDPTEVALITLALKAGRIPSDLRDRFRRNAELPFDPSAQMMATEHRLPNGKTRVILKGAPEAILGLCGFVRRGADERMTQATRNDLIHGAEAMASGALRVLAIAIVEGVDIEGHLGFEPYRGLATLLGFVGENDPARPEARKAVRDCQEAGVRAVIVTGDHKMTASAIARELGIGGKEARAIDGRELEGMSEEVLSGMLDRVSVFARVQPAQKLRILKAFQKRGEVVAMTGDGVNDAPALVKADVGVAMGITGTEVAKEAAKIVITDDNFASIVAAVEEGRIVYRNIKKVVLFLISTSFSEVAVLLLALIFGFPPPFAAVQILWNNLVTEGTITLNLIMEPKEGDEMLQKPVSPKEPLLTRMLLSRMVLMVGAMTTSTLGWFSFRILDGVPFAQVQSETFTLLVVCEWFNILNCRSEIRSALTLRTFRNLWLVGGLFLSNLLQVAVIFLPSFNRIFHTVPIDLDMVFAIGLVGSLVLWVEEARKLVLRRKLRMVPLALASGT